MKKRDYRDYLRDIADAVSDIGAFTKGLSCAAFLENRDSARFLMVGGRRKYGGEARS